MIIQSIEVCLSFGDQCLDKVKKKKKTSKSMSRNVILLGLLNKYIMYVQLKTEVSILSYLEYLIRTFLVGRYLHNSY